MTAAIDNASDLKAFYDNKVILCFKRIFLKTLLSI